MTDKLALITVVYNNYDVLEDFFKSLDSQKSKNFHLFIADLSDKKQKIDKPYATIIEGENLGFSHGVNLGLGEATKQDFDKFCVINNDIYMKKDFINHALKSINNNPGSLIGGKIYYAAGYEYHKDRYAKSEIGHVLWYAGGEIDWKNVYIKHRGVDEVDRGQHDKLETTDFITGCIICFDKNVLNKIGYWDDKYFLYYEDADYSVRAKKRGMKTIYDPSIVIWHKNSESTGKPGSAVHKKYQEQSRLRFGLKYAPLRTKIHLIKNSLISSS